ncbi:uncharacterized protein N7473_004390 [Penicillium subrubescens]|nr:uncharacterized protein N7473_004390 [Penicillium subrubescens]KAJ5900320.1 hypothetical protein N7473_004390 [Penicillium subrubescens]
MKRFPGKDNEYSINVIIVRTEQETTITPKRQPLRQPRRAKKSHQVGIQIKREEQGEQGEQGEQVEEDDDLDLDNNLPDPSVLFNFRPLPRLPSRGVSDLLAGISQQIRQEDEQQIHQIIRQEGEQQIHQIIHQETEQETEQDIEETEGNKESEQGVEETMPETEQEVSQEVSLLSKPRRRRREISTSSLVSPPRTRKRYQLKPQDHERMQASGPTPQTWSRSQD